MESIVLICSPNKVDMKGNKVYRRPKKKKKVLSPNFMPSFYPAEGFFL